MPGVPNNNLLKASLTEQLSVVFSCLLVLQSCLGFAARLLAACRAAGMTVVHTMEAHKPDLSDLHTSKLKRGNPPQGCRIGDQGDMGKILIRGEPGNGIVDEVAPVEVTRNSLPIKNIVVLWQL